MTKDDASESGFGLGDDGFEGSCCEEGGGNDKRQNVPISNPITTVRKDSKQKTSQRKRHNSTNRLHHQQLPYKTPQAHLEPPPQNPPAGPENDGFEGSCCGEGGDNDKRQKIPISNPITTVRKESKPKTRSKKAKPPHPPPPPPATPPPIHPPPPRGNPHFVSTTAFPSPEIHPPSQNGFPT